MIINIDMVNSLQKYFCLCDLDVSGLCMQVKGKSDDAFIPE
jgi:hypothetical protein